MSKYTPKVRELIGCMQRGAVIRKSMEKSSHNYFTGTTNYRAVYWMNRQEISERAWDALTATLNDLITYGPNSCSDSLLGMDALLAKNRYALELTERGQNIRWNKKGEEMPEGWEPEPAKPSVFWGPTFFLCPSRNVVFRYDHDHKLASLLCPVTKEPLLQIPSILCEGEWDALKIRRVRWKGGVIVKTYRKGKRPLYTCKDYQEVPETGTATYMEYEEWAAQKEQVA